MSYIPASAMPHAKPHEHHEGGEHHDAQAGSAPQPRAKSSSDTAQASGSHSAPWIAAIAVGGALAIGAAATAFVFSRRDKQPAKKSGGRKGNAGRKSGGKRAD